jgi:hypothetical protein
VKRYCVGLALVACVSAVAIRGLDARTTTPPVYVVVEIDEITDANGFEALRKTDGLPAEKRGIYLERIVAWLRFRDGRFIDRDLDDAVRLALRGLIHESAA